MDAQVKEGGETSTSTLQALFLKYADVNYYIQSNVAKDFISWLESHYHLVEEGNKKEEARYAKLILDCGAGDVYLSVLALLKKLQPALVLFSNFHRVKPLIHLDHLATRIEQNSLDDDQYDYGNQCLLKLLGFSARELSTLGRAPEPSASDAEAQQKYRDQLDKRWYQLNAASVRLTEQIVRIWNPNPDRAEASRLRIRADGQYLKVVVEDELGVEIELDQRSEGFQWIVSFFIVFFAEAKDKHSNAILLLDEPGLSLHALKQRDFRGTISLLSKSNQTIYTTHSPFLVGPDELDMVRVVEMTDRRIGTKIHTSVTAGDAAGLLPLQEALGYDLAQSLFSQQRNLILEGLTDYWYLEACASMLRQDGICDLNPKIALIPSNTAGKVVYFATFLSSNNLKVAALLDSDNAGDQAAKQDILVHRLGNKRILRTADYLTPAISKAEIEDLLRDTLPLIAKSDLGIDIESEISASPAIPIIDIFTKKAGSSFSKYKLAKSFVRWTRDNGAHQLSERERVAWSKLINAINAALK